MSNEDSGSTISSSLPNSIADQIGNYVIEVTETNTHIQAETVVKTSTESSPRSGLATTDLTTSTPTGGYPSGTSDEQMTSPTSTNDACKVLGGRSWIGSFLVAVLAVI
jgi:hypothetical protein